MNVSDAAYITGHDYPGGTAALGPRIGVSGNVLSNKLNPNINTHHLTLSEAMRIMAITGDLRMLHAMASELGVMIKPMPMVADESLLSALAHTANEFGQYLTAINDALKDGRITKLELRKVEKELGDLVAQSNKLMASLEAMEAHHE